MTALSEPRVTGTQQKPTRSELPRSEDAGPTSPWEHAAPREARPLPLTGWSYPLAEFWKKPGRGFARTLHAFALGIRTMTSRMIQSLMLLGLFMAPGACTCKKSDEELLREYESGNESLPESLKPIELTLYGLNYTDLYISSFSVSGIGGADIPVSSPTAGSSGGVCCIPWYPGAALPIPIKVSWTRDNMRRCEKEVMITGPVPSNPENFAVHFFPDGHIEIELTEDYPTLKLRLERYSPTQRKQSGNAVLDEQVAKCKNVNSQ